MIPVTVPVAQVPLGIERDLENCQALLLAVVEQLQQSLGTAALTPTLRRVSTCIAAAKLNELQDQVTAELKAGRGPQAARLLHDETGARWDEVHAVIAQWNTLPVTKRLHWLRSFALHQALKS